MIAAMGPNFAIAGKHGAEDIAANLLARGNPARVIKNLQVDQSE